jgi:chromosomal replication initiator protein
VVRDPAKIWDAALGELRLGMNQANYESYLAGTAATAFDEDGLELVVAVPNPLVRETLEQRFRPAINRALYDVLGQACKVRLVTGGGRGGASLDGYGMFGLADEDRSERRPRETADERSLTSVNGANGGGTNGTSARRNGRAAGPEPLASVGRGGAPLNGRYTFERFVVGNSNRLAHAASEAVAEAPGHAYNPLFLYGGVGLGKTHLLHAIGHKVLEQGLSVVYVSSETFTNELIESIREHRTDDFRARYRRAGLLMIDDIQFIASKERTQEEFFHTFNAIHEGGGQIVLTSDKQPKAIPTLEDRLRSRFEMGLIADVQPPDLETRIAILRSKVNGRVQVPDDVVDFIAHKVQSNIRELEGSLNRVTAYATLHQRPLSVELAAAALADLVAPTRTTHKPDSILDAVARYYGVELAELRGKARNQKIVTPRHLAMYLLREDARLSLPQIGALLGGRDHTSVIHACEKVTAEIERDGAARNDARAVRESLR